MAESLDAPHEVEFELPETWKTVVTALTGTGRCFRAADYDELVDSPILCGNPAVYRFDVDGMAHVLANEGEQGVWDGPRSAADAEKLVRQHGAMWGGLPYETYTFLICSLSRQAGWNIATRRV